MSHTEKEAKKYKEYLKELVSQVEQYVSELDGIMDAPASYDRGVKMATALNKLNYSKDRAKHFGLGLSLKK